MTRLGGITISQLNEWLDSMRKVYPFKNDFTKIVSITDPRMGDNEPCRLEIYTKDAETGVEITMSKSKEFKYEWNHEDTT